MSASKPVLLVVIASTRPGRVGLPAVDVMGVVRRPGGELAGPHPISVFAAAAALVVLTVVNQEVRHARR